MSDPIQSEYTQMMNELAHDLDAFFNGNREPKKVGFALLVFNLQPGADQRANYISNCSRADMVAAMKEVAARFEGRIADTERKQ